MLALVILWYFLRHFRSTLVVTITIPLCLCIAFVVILGVGKSINVVSLAGLAFAIGMVMDAAIIVLENIVRLREKGYSAFDAALKGTQEVWPALLASTATTVAIFLPILFLRDQSGQLFSDLAIAITAAIVTSMLVATILIPAASMVWLRQARFEDHLSASWDRASHKIIALTRSPRLRLALVAGLIIIPIASSWQFFP